MTNQPAKQNHDQRHVSSHGWLVALLLIGLLGTAAPAIADTTTPAHTDSSTVSIGIAHSPLVDSQLEDIRGRYVPPTRLEANSPIAVILWDEGTPGQVGTGKHHQRSDGRTNLQQTTLKSRSVR